MFLHGYQEVHLGYQSALALRNLEVTGGAKVDFCSLLRWTPEAKSVSDCAIFVFFTSDQASVFLCIREDGR